MISEADRKAAIDRTLQKQARLWPATKRVIAQDNPDPIEASLLAAINDVFDAHSIRLAAVFDELPKIAMWLLLFVAAAALTVGGFNAGIQGRMSRWRMSAFTMVLTGLMLVILDFDRPNDGAVIVSQYSIHTAISDMEIDLRQ